MAPKVKISEKYRIWIEARKKHRLSHAQVQMARELGMNPKKLGSLDNHRQESWKVPLPQFIEGLYLKRFGKQAPDNVRPIEKLAQDKKKKKTKIGGTHTSPVTYNK
ncbi:MAG: hypothetical protein GY868_10060 [Deltaproteobacteria bacterium]|nr:hypothetical protein [Deltaproteobacteria bacterium]